MKILKFIICILFVLSCSVRKESIDRLISLENDYAKNLKAQGIDTICFYRGYITDDAIKFITNASKDNRVKCNIAKKFPTYIFWKKQNDIYLSKIDNCYEYSVLKINSTVWNQLESNFDEIKTEEIKRFEYIKEENGKKETYINWDAHSDRHQLWILYNDQKISKIILENNFKELDIINDEKSYNTRCAV